MKRTEAIPKPCVSVASRAAATTCGVIGEPEVVVGAEVQHLLAPSTRIAAFWGRRGCAPACRAPGRGARGSGVEVAEEGPVHRKGLSTRSAAGGATASRWNCLRVASDAPAGEALAFPDRAGSLRPSNGGEVALGTTRRSLLKSAGVAAAGSVLLKGRAGAAPAASGTTEALGLRALTYCMLRLCAGRQPGGAPREPHSRRRQGGKLAQGGRAGQHRRSPRRQGRRRAEQGPPAPRWARLAPRYLTVEEARFGPCITRPAEDHHARLQLPEARAGDRDARSPRRRCSSTSTPTRSAAHEGTVTAPDQGGEEVRLRGGAASSSSARPRASVSEADALSHVFGYADWERLLRPRPPVPRREGLAVHDRQDLRRVPAHRAAGWSARSRCPIRRS